MQEIDWITPFNPAYGLIAMPANMFVYYRGYDPTYPSISERPAYYGSFITAQSYTKLHGRILGSFTNERELKLMDVRFMKDILTELFHIHYSENDESILPVVLSFGLCSLFHQCKLAKQRFRTPDMASNLKALMSSYKESNFEQRGYRIAETTNDSHTMGFLKTIFEGFVDGFISPRQMSPFHIEKGQIMNAEYVIFNPKKSGIVMFETIPYTVPIPPKNVEWLYERDTGKKIHLGTLKHPYNLYTLSGGRCEDDSLPSVEDIAQKMDNDAIVREHWNSGVEAGKRWKTMANFGIAEAPVVTAKELGDWSSIPDSSNHFTRKRRMTRKNLNK